MGWGLEVCYSLAERRRKIIIGLFVIQATIPVICMRCFHPAICWHLGCLVSRYRSGCNVAKYQLRWAWWCLLSKHMELIPAGRNQ